MILLLCLLLSYFYLPACKETGDQFQKGDWFSKRRLVDSFVSLRKVHQIISNATWAFITNGSFSKVNCRNTEMPPQTQQSKQDEKAEKYSAGKGTW